MGWKWHVVMLLDLEIVHEVLLGVPKNVWKYDVCAFEAALREGSDVVRVGTAIFGTRHLKGE